MQVNSSYGVPSTTPPSALSIAREFVGYFAVSLAGLAVDAIVLLILISGCGLPVVYSSVAAFMAGLAVVYLCSVKFVFAKRRVAQPAIEFFTFAMLGIAGLLLTMLIMQVGTQQLHLDYRWTKIGAAGASFICNFALRKLVLFSRA
ncbi:putative flippase GtrA [Variovorax paradoxus]|uniref:GtrA family protein n=1 Tax=Variovorax paradoxus TaxID=34073 RepID=UPI0027874940|nr:GtrA family protein [Variovorax paradoxus]MDP9965972.1 putative flippase GtrA [Variovorax paradoxus]